ncbi:hypothetical protein F4776DRAFT_504768 [Hypoxylon sp. NC0597]|nr:hypothetical protein F4776DRAFT_504768 [Hypoxylon sp. NC0597]
MAAGAEGIGSTSLPPVSFCRTSTDSHTPNFSTAISHPIPIPFSLLLACILFVFPPTPHNPSFYFCSLVIEIDWDGGLIGIFLSVLFLKRVSPGGAPVLEFIPTYRILPRDHTCLVLYSPLTTSYFQAYLLGRFVLSLTPVFPMTLFNL